MEYMLCISKFIPAAIFFLFGRLFFCHVRFMQLDRPDLLFPLELQVQHFDKYRKRHRKVDVPFRNMLMQSFDNQGKADEQ